MDDGCWTRKVKAATVEGHLGRGRSRFGWLDTVKLTLAVREVGLQEETLLEKGMCAEIS